MKTVLVANRGEVARRIIAACRKLGIKTVAIFSDADRRSPHVAEADLALNLPGATAEETYLNQQAIISLAKSTGADAIHPGFGFLAENEVFARLCSGSGIRFIGPSAETMQIAGDKGASRAAAEIAGVPVIPGYNGGDNSNQKLAAAADECGYPLIVKAAAGGGGKGMRRVADQSALQPALDAARREALRAFGDDRLIIERDVAPARHIEVQLLGDCTGTVIHLFERECSFQRRFQKIIEESPAPALEPSLRDRILSSALAIGRQIRLENAATVEFLIPLTRRDGDSDFYFIEINPRLQVEHPVTELVCGIDIVAWQIRIARGEAISLGQDQIIQSGHAIEARVYAEVPEDGFLPAVGAIRWFSLPASTEFIPERSPGGLRIDHALSSGLEVTTRYDPMLGKIIAHGTTREEAASILNAALRATSLAGVDTNIPFLRRVLELPVPIDSGYLDREVGERVIRSNFPWDAGQLAAIAASSRAAAAVLSHSDDPYFSTALWRGARSTTASQSSVAIESRPLKLKSGHLVSIDGLAQISTRQVTVRCTVDGKPCEVNFEARSALGPFRAAVSIAGSTLDAAFVAEDQPIGLLGPAAGGLNGTALIEGYCVRYAVTAGPLQQQNITRTGGPVSETAVVAPLPGTVAEVKVMLGETVIAGQVLAVIESMKMEHPVAAPFAGVVSSVNAKSGAQIRDGEEILRLAPSNP